MRRSYQILLAGILLLSAVSAHAQRQGPLLKEHHILPVTADSTKPAAIFQVKNWPYGALQAPTANKPASAQPVFSAICKTSGTAFRWNDVEAITALAMAAYALFR
ncbi:hypothetical protein [Chitinophaga sp. 212800010-3]|uniref:hypothetical protein n=1 Tax=unclassified Chitinophaga TaxID=2619133 RepID=UPI002DE7DDF0|nr:hypothetical protein [Chitinophaga sp. 212800010-3]